MIWASAAPRSAAGPVGRGMLVAASRHQNRHSRCAAPSPRRGYSSATPMAYIRARQSTSPQSHMHTSRTSSDSLCHRLFLVPSHRLPTPELSSRSTIAALDVPHPSTHLGRRFLSPPCAALRWGGRLLRLLLWLRGVVGGVLLRVLLLLLLPCRIGLLLLLLL